MRNFLARVPEAEGLAVAAFGGALFAVSGLPAAWLSGATIFAAIYAVSFGRVVTRPRMIEVTLLLVGIATGATVTPKMLEAVRQYPLSLVMLALTMAAAMLLQYLWLRRMHGWSKPTAMMATAPGALAAIVATSAECGLDVPRIAAVQSFRVFVLIAVLPNAVSILQADSLAAASALAANPLDFGMMMAAGLFCALLFERLGFSAPLIFGGMLGSAALHLTGAAQGVFPPLLNNLCFVLMGCVIASRLVNLDKRMLKELLATSFATFVIALLVAAAGAFAASYLLGLPFEQVLVAYSPGGFEAMIALSAALGLDPLYAGSHHMARFLGVSLMIPVFLKLAGVRKPG